MAAVDLLLVGREGNGKSSTGNSILNKKVFTNRGVGTETSDDILKSSTLFDKMSITVVDGLSIRDNSIDGKDNVLATIGLAKKAVANVNGFTALLIVLKYGVRFTNQEKSALSIIRSLFGSDVIKNHGVIVMTHGDSFANDMEDEGTTFESWCREQTGDVRDLFNECGHRYVLFNNRTKDIEQMKEQLKNLMSKVAEIQTKVSRYTMDTFRNATLGQKKLLVQSKLPELQKETNGFLDSVMQRLRKLDDSFYSPSNYLKELEMFKKEIDSYKSYLQKEDEETNSIGQLLLQISVTEASISIKKERYSKKLEFESILPPGERKSELIPFRLPLIRYAVPIFIVAIILFVALWIFAF